MFCGTTLDLHGDHAILCRCGGDSSYRHDRVRDTLGSILRDSGFNPEIEKPGLLPDDPGEDACWEFDDSVPTTRSRRRPADIFLHRWPSATGRSGVAFDVAVTSFMQGSGPNSDPGLEAVKACLESYAKKKMAFQETAAKCARQGIDFVPLIFEAQGGGWSAGVADILSTAAKRADARRSDSQIWNQSTAAIYAQRLSVALQRATSRATLRRESPGMDRFQ